MSRRMIDEGALNAQIQEATTTKQDKLYTKTDSGITLAEEEGKSYIGSKLVYTNRTVNMYPVFRAGTYALGDVVAHIRYNLDESLCIGEEYETNAKTIIKIDDVVMLRVVRPEAQMRGNPACVSIVWYAIQGGTITAQQQPETRISLILIPKDNCFKKD